MIISRLWISLSNYIYNLMEIDNGDKQSRYGVVIYENICYWSQPFLKGLIFGIGHYFTYRVLGPQIKALFNNSGRSTA